MNKKDVFGNSMVLSDNEVTVILVRDYLYDGSWDEMKKDLTEKKDSAKYADRQHEITKILRDLETIKKLEDFEKLHECDLSIYLPKTMV